MAARVRGLFSVYICIEKFKILFVRNHLTDFNITLQECCFGDPLARLFVIMILQKNMAAKGWGLFSLISKYKTLKVFLSETTEPISI